jgi:ribonucleoside-diphosphate reductase alpha chain
MKFRLPDGRFDSDAFRAAVRIFITAQEIIVDNAAYPTEKIADNSHNCSARWGWAMRTWARC